jgi:serine/threonine protein kinase
VGLRTISHPGGLYSPQSDLHASGVVFYECLTGEHPFNTSLPDDMLLREVAYEDPLNAISLNSAVPLGLNKVVVRLLKKDPRDRYQHGDLVANDLRARGSSGHREISLHCLSIVHDDKRAHDGWRRRLRLLGVQIGDRRAGHACAGP